MAASGSGIIRIRGGDRWKRELRRYLPNGKISVDVGILEGATYSGETTPAGTPVAAIGAIQEFGTDRIEARSFMRSTLMEKQDEWLRKVIAYLRQNPTEIRNAFALLGEIASKDIQKKIDDGVPPRSSQATIEYKRRRGRQNPETTLIDTGTLQESISYEVKEG